MSDKVCSVEGCGGKHYAKGLCKKHYQQTPDRKAKNNARMRAYYQTPEYKAYRKAPEVKSAAWASALWRKYGITPEQYEAALAAQGGVCWICERPETLIDPRAGEVRRLSVDHCHETGVNRGLLCAAHNQAIGLFNHDIDLLREAIKYLERFGARDAESDTNQPTQTEETDHETSHQQ